MLLIAMLALAEAEAGPPPPEAAPQWAVPPPRVVPPPLVAPPPRVALPLHAGPKRRSARPLVPLHRLFSHGDYPAAAIRTREEGLVAVRLEVAPMGRVTACRIVSSSGSAMLDATTCRILYARAKFHPARDAKGRPVADRVNSRVVWRFPPPPIEPPPPQPSR
jgi:protein TonB